MRGDELATARTPLNPMLADAFHTGLTRRMPITNGTGARQDGGAIIAPSRGKETVDGEWSLEEACDRFIAAHVNGAWTAKTETKNRASLGMFKQFAGAGTPLSEIDRRMVGDYKALIERLPITHGKRAAYRDRSLQSIVEEAEKRGAERLAPTTIQGT